MVYSSLSLKKGGGILSEQQQAEPDPNAVHLLIGLGGTGIDCIAEIKKQVYACIKPDDPEAEVPTYQKIQFLAVDADLHNDGLAIFDTDEIFDISSWNVKEELRNKSRIENHVELDWLDLEKIHTENIGELGAGGSRVVGRYLLMEHSDQFLGRVKEMIQNGEKRAGTGKIYVHLLAGLGGGLGSGCFLDVCYLVRKAIKEEGVDAIVSGYFFLPDVSLAKVPPSVVWVRDYIKKNGYAAMQELDYCMKIGENGGAFVQNYKRGIQAAWEEPPVDVCFLLSAMNQYQRTGESACQDVKKKVTLYILSCLMKGGTEWLKKEHLFLNSKRREKKSGYQNVYCTIGMARTGIPLREMNTYLATKTFEAFSAIKNQVPTEKEIVELAERAKIFNLNELLLEIMKNEGRYFEIEPEPEDVDWMFTRKYGDEKLVNWYENQKTAQFEILEKNAAHMMDENSADSLLARVCEEIDACAADLNRGPVYAYYTVKSNYRVNLQDLIKGNLAELEYRMKLLENTVYREDQSRRNLCEQSRKKWESEKNKLAFFGKLQTAYRKYTENLERLVRDQIELKAMENLKEVLQNLKEQIADRAINCYAKFNRVMNHLMDTFEENSSVLNASVKESDCYAVRMITMKEFYPELDRAVSEINMAELFQQFVSEFLDQPEMWAEENERKISGIVRKFFMEDAFSRFADYSITSFLREKYGRADETEIIDHLHRDYMMKLRDWSQTFFPTDPFVWNSTMQRLSSYIFVPTQEQTVMQAAQRLMQHYVHDINQSAFAEEIYMIRFLAEIPIGAYAKTKEYEKSYFKEEQEERHIYMGKGGAKWFNDWNRLPSIVPESCMRGRLPDKLQNLLDKARKIYFEGCRRNLIYEGRIRQFSDDTVQMMEEMTALVDNAGKEAEGKSNADGMLREIRKRLEMSIETQQFTYKDMEYSLPREEGMTAEIEKNYFISNPALQNIVKRDLDRIDAVKDAIERVKQRIRRLETCDKERKNLSQALLTGVIQGDEWRGLVFYERKVPQRERIILYGSVRGEHFPYVKVPLYQTYISYLDLRPDIKDEIQKATKGKIEAFDDEFVERVKWYAEKITPENISRFIAAAEKTPEILEEANELIQVLNKEVDFWNKKRKALGL